MHRSRSSGTTCGDTGAGWLRCDPRSRAPAFTRICIGRSTRTVAASRHNTVETHSRVSLAGPSNTQPAPRLSRGSGPNNQPQRTPNDDDPSQRNEDTRRASHPIHDGNMGCHLHESRPRGSRRRFHSQDRKRRGEISKIVSAVRLRGRRQAVHSLIAE